MKKLEVLIFTGAVYFFLLALFIGLFGAAVNIKSLRFSGARTADQEKSSDVFYNSDKDGIYSDDESGEADSSRASDGAGLLSKDKKAGDSVRLPILMYHSILNSAKGTYIVSEEQLENDLNALKEAGYTMVFPSEIIAYAKGIGTLPEKPALISFDDGYYNNLYYALPIFKRCGAKGVINVIGRFTEAESKGENSNPNYSHLTWNQINEISKSGCFEIGNHTYDMHRFKPRYGMARKYGETDEQYRAAIRRDLIKLQDMLDGCMGVRIDASPDSIGKVRKESFVRTIAFPYGRVTPIAKEQALDMGFEMLLTCTEGVNVIRASHPESLYGLKRINRSGYYTTARVMQKVNA